ncbi:response regulator transcription factor [Acidothermaceae bacterium B102]|nr:response regulator transcription factor [Acidothermaceae bacterium B102]
MTAVLVGEHNLLVAAPLSEALRSQGYDVALVEDGPSVLRSAASGWAGLVVLDADLPDGSGGSGLEVIRALRTQASDLPVIMVSDAREETDAVSSLDAGADDFLTLPLRHDEVLARIRALLRRSRPEPVEVQDVRVDPASRRAWLQDSEIVLTTKEFDLLRVLVREAGSVVTREQLIHEVWDLNWRKSTKTLDMHISWLRRKLGDEAAHPRYISTLRGVGFRFERG